jgi:myo-inositol 2-dehydrogenase/D-chiro-inositol 1-dehydrogenase
MTLKLAVVGIGKVARNNYLPFLAKQSDVALGYFNRTPDRAIEAAANFGGKAFSSLEELIQWQPMSVLILTSEICRHDYAIKLIEAGVPHLFFEKPLLASRGQANIIDADFHQARELIHRAQEKDCSTAMVYNYRFFEHTQAAQAVSKERSLGSLINILGLVHYACWSHVIDLIRHFAGQVVEIAALGGSTVRKADVTQSEAADITASFLLENGASGALIGTAGMLWQHPLYELILTFERGRIHLRDLDGAMEVLDGNGPFHETRGIVRNISRWNQYKDSFDKSLGAYLNSLRENKKPPIGGIEGLYELQFQVALNRAIAEKRLVRVQEEFPV